MPNLVHAPYPYHPHVDKDFNYTYPMDLDLHPNSKPHQRLVDLVTTAADESFQVMSLRHDRWKEVDRTMNVYIPLTEYEKRLKQRRRDDEEMSALTKPVSIVVPYTYAVEDTMLTYLVQAFLTGQIFDYEGFGPEDEVAAKLLGLVVQKQTAYYKTGLEIHTAFRDGLRYGICAATLEWDRQWGQRPVKHTTMVPGIDGNSIPVEEYIPENTLLFEGNKVYTIDPYRFLPDPNVSIHRVQDMEYIGWVSISNYNQMYAAEREINSPYFNVKYLKTSDGNTQISTRYTNDESAREDGINGGSGAGKLPKTASTHKVTNVNMFMRIIPSEYELSTSDVPEIWFFTLSNGQFITRAQPLGLYHNMYPISVGAPDYDGYSITPTSRMEILSGLQTSLNWLYNSHIANVRKAINDQYVIDPSAVNVADFSNPMAGKLIRLRRGAFGRSVRDVVGQLQTADITSRNIGDAGFVADLMQRISAATDAVQGVVRTGGERRSATEYRGTMSGALSRMERISWIMSQMFMRDLGYFHACHTQQLMSKETYVRLMGEWTEVLGQIHGQARVVKPQDIMVDFDIICKDGSIPSAAGSADIWVQLWQAAMQNQEVSMKLDIPRIFMHITTLLGAKNVFDFVRKGGDVDAQLMTEEDIDKMTRAGNLVPLGAAK